MLNKYGAILSVEQDTIVGNLNLPWKHDYIHDQKHKLRS